VLDEEHDHSYKQDSSPRYVTRAVAEQRAALCGCPVILGSATPSVETFYRAEKGALGRLDLPLRIHDRPLPEVRVVDLREEFRHRGASVFSRELREEIARGCRGASRSSSSSTAGVQRLHPLSRLRLCATLPTLQRVADFSCRQCRSPRLPSLRPRAARAEHLPSLCGDAHPSFRDRHSARGGRSTRNLPEARLARLDRDTTTGKDSHAEIIGRFKERDADILIGTQMVAKGFDSRTSPLSASSPPTRR